MSSRSSPGEPQSAASAPANPSPASAPTPTRTSPKVTKHDAGVELKGMSASENAKGSIPLGEDVMQIARLGEVSVMQKLFESRKFHAGYSDEEGITPLHVCALCSLPLLSSTSSADSI
jgi:hypothetical protein